MRPEHPSQGGQLLCRAVCPYYAVRCRAPLQSASNDTPDVCQHIWHHSRSCYLTEHECARCHFACVHEHRCTLLAGHRALDYACRVRCAICTCTTTCLHGRRCQLPMLHWYTGDTDERICQISCLECDSLLAAPVNELLGASNPHGGPWTHVETADVHDSDSSFDFCFDLHLRCECGECEPQWISRGWLCLKKYTRHIRKIRCGWLEPEQICKQTCLTVRVCTQHK